MGFARANLILVVPLGPGFGFDQITFTTLIFLVGAAFTGATFAFFTPSITIQKPQHTFVGTIS
jgi:hypothetical protein